LTFPKGPGGWECYKGWKSLEGLPNDIAGVKGWLFDSGCKLGSSASIQNLIDFNMIRPGDMLDENLQLGWICQIGPIIPETVCSCTKLSSIHTNRITNDAADVREHVLSDVVMFPVELHWGVLKDVSWWPVTLKGLEHTKYADCVLEGGGRWGIQPFPLASHAEGLALPTSY
jgi:hypothetical protein